MARYKIVQETKDTFFVYKKRLGLFWKCLNPIDWKQWNSDYIAFSNFEAAYCFYVSVRNEDEFVKVKWTYD
jgi:hypothetical protein